MFKAHLQQLKSRENIENQRFTTFSPALQLLKMVLCSSKVFTFILFLFLFSERCFFMLLSDLLQVINPSAFLGIHELSEDGNNYDMNYTGQIKTKSEYNRVIEKYGKGKIKKIDTGINERLLIYIE